MLVMGFFFSAVASYIVGLVGKFEQPGFGHDHHRRLGSRRFTLAV